MKRSKTVLLDLPSSSERGKIPTTFVPLSPEKILFGDEADVLVGLFHMMWSDMPRRTTYRVRLSEFYRRDGQYSGCKLACMNKGMLLIEC